MCLSFSSKHKQWRQNSRIFLKANHCDKMMSFFVTFVSYSFTVVSDCRACSFKPIFTVSLLPKASAKIQILTKESKNIKKSRRRPLELHSLRTQISFTWPQVWYFTWNKLLFVNSAQFLSNCPDRWAFCYPLLVLLQKWNNLLNQTWSKHRQRFKACLKSPHTPAEMQKQNKSFSNFFHL